MNTSIAGKFFHEIGRFFLLHDIACQSRTSHRSEHIFRRIFFSLMVVPSYPIWPPRGIRGDHIESKLLKQVAAELPQLRFDYYPDPPQNYSSSSLPNHSSSPPAGPQNPDAPAHKSLQEENGGAEAASLRKSKDDDDNQDVFDKDGAIRAESFLTDYKIFDDLSVWQRVRRRMLFSISIKVDVSGHEALETGEACGGGKHLRKLRAELRETVRKEREQRAAKRTAEGGGGSAAAAAAADGGGGSTGSSSTPPFDDRDYFTCRDSSHVVLGAAALYWSFCGDKMSIETREGGEEEVDIPSVCIPYYGTGYGTRGTKLGEMLMCYIGEILSKTIWTHPDHVLKYEKYTLQNDPRTRRSANRKDREAERGGEGPRRFVEIYVPATPRAESFWKKMGGLSQEASEGNHLLQVPESVVEEMHCFSKSSTTLYWINYLHLLTNFPSPPKMLGNISDQRLAKNLPSLPNAARINAAASRACSFRAVRKGGFEAGICRFSGLLFDAQIKEGVNNWSILHEAVQRRDVGEATAFTHQLLKKKIPPNMCDADWKQSPIFFAANMNRAGIIELVCQHGAKPKQNDLNGQTTLYYAARAGAMETAKLLVEKYHVDPMKRDRCGRLAMTYAEQSDKNGSHAEMIAFLRGEDGGAQGAATAKAGEESTAKRQKAGGKMAEMRDGSHG